MVLLNLLLVLILTWQPVSAPYIYKAIVIDARTREPLPGVTVLDLENHANIVSDATGHFTIETTLVTLRLSYIGYIALNVARPDASNRVDTLCLQPAPVALGEIIVRPTRPLLLSPIGRNHSRQPSLSLYPGAQVAVLYQPIQSLQVTQIDQLLLRFSGAPVLAGRLRVRLLLADKTVGSDGIPYPGTHELLPAPLEFTTKELAATPKQLLVDLTRFNLNWPAEGVYVILDGLTSEPTQKYLSATIFSTKKGPEIRALIAAADGTQHTTPVDDFPALAAGASDSPGRTWTWNKKRNSWILLGNSKDSNAAKSNNNRNCAVSLLVQVQ